MEEGRISAAQFGSTLITIIIGTSILYVPSLTVFLAGRDAWLSPMAACLVGLGVLLAVIGLHKEFPGQTPVQYLKKLFGSWIGSACGAYLLIVFLRYLAAILREMTDFTVTVALRHTPPDVVLMLMLAVVVYAVWGGLEVIARVTQFVLLIEVMQLVSAVVVLSSKDVQVGHFTPLFENGLAPLGRASLLMTGWITELVLVGFILPSVRAKTSLKKASCLSLLTVTLLLTLSEAFTIGVFGPDIAGNLQFGLYEVGRYVSVANFLERLDPIVMGVWIMLMFCKITIFAYVITMGAAQLFGLKDYRPLGAVVCTLAGVMSEQIFRDQTDETRYFLFSYPCFAFVMSVLMPIVVYAYARLTRRRRRSEATQQG